MVDLSNYFDYAASTPIDDRVLKAMIPYFSDKFYNPSAIYDRSRQIRKDINLARNNIAKWLGAKPAEIIFTAGATEANNLAIKGTMDLWPGKNLVVSSIEHESVLKPAKTYSVKQCKVDKNGLIDQKALKELIDHDTVLVSVMYANNEIGTIQPIKKISEIIDEIKTKRKNTNIKTPLYLHTDMAQATNYLDLHSSRLGADLMTVNGGKIYGPKQSGILYVNTGIKLNPQIVGGNQERGLRSGTENTANIIGFAKALDIAQRSRKNEFERLEQLKNKFLEILRQKNITFELNGSVKHRLPNNLNLSFKNFDNETILIKLDNMGYMVATGSACSASNDSPSHVLTAIGANSQHISSSLRITFGRYTTTTSIENLANALAKMML